jgi:phosphoribosylaminoimidazole-succinocarboxamide synthase
MTLPHLHTGSVKEIKGIKGQSPYVFEFSDRYSIFDWGAMPDYLESKGECLAAMADLFFKKLGDPSFWREWIVDMALFADYNEAVLLLDEFREKGVSHHCLGLVGNDVKPTVGLSNSLAVEPVHVPKVHFDSAIGSWDYSEFESSPTKTLVPLEVIFRLGVPEGSSLMKRVKDSAYLADIGLTKTPFPGDQFETPVIEFSTKLETTDRYVSNKEAQSISGMNEVEFQRTKSFCLLLALRLKDMFHSIGIKLWDGKFEFAFELSKDSEGNRHLQLIDSIGPDELRLTYNGIQLSKENLRRFYRDSEWYKQVEQAKGLAKDRNEQNWKSICVNELKSSPQILTEEQRTAASMMYKTLTNALFEKYEGKTPYSDTWNLNLLTDKMERL